MEQPILFPHRCRRLSRSMSVIVVLQSRVVILNPVVPRPISVSQSTYADSVVTSSGSFSDSAPDSSRPKISSGELVGSSRVSTLGS